MTSNEKNTKNYNSNCRPFIGLVSFTQTSNHAIVFVFLLLLSTSVGAQPTRDQQYEYARFSPSMAIIIVVLVAALFFMGFFSIYIRHCSETTGGGPIRPVLSLRSRRSVAARGLDPAMIENFPTFPYSVVKGLKIGKGALECAVCLNEFEDDETLRLIPKCDHVFHPECIDAWLTSHVTCPVCRASLVLQPGESIDPVPHESQLELDTENNVTDQVDSRSNGDVSIRVTDDQEIGSAPTEMMNRNLSFKQNRPARSWSTKPRLFGSFGKFRSHSTGHSLVQPGENLDRFTLRLPEEARKEVMKRGLLNRTASCAVILHRESSSRRGYRTGESSTRGRSYRRLEKLDPVVKSDRWVFSMTPPFFPRTLSMKSPKVMADNGEASTSSATPRGLMTAIKTPFACLEPKGADEAGLVSADSVRHPV